MNLARALLSAAVLEKALGVAHAGIVEDQANMMQERQLGR
jgi:hypothetical protein